MTAIGPVTSNSQGGQGITAGAIGTVNQILPTLVRGPLLEHFKESFTEGAKMRSALLNQDLSNEQYMDLFQKTQAWAQSTYGWLQKDVSAYAAERFDFRVSFGMSYGLVGGHDPKVVQTRNDTIVSLAGWLQNLDMLMREPTLYPDH